MLVRMTRAMAQNYKMSNITFMTSRSFTGKTETGHKFTTPKLRMRYVNPIYPPPGLSLRAPETLDVETFMRQIGGDCEEVAEKFENMDEVLDMSSI